MSKSGAPRKHPRSRDKSAPFSSSSDFAKKKRFSTPKRKTGVSRPPTPPNPRPRGDLFAERAPGGEDVHVFVVGRERFRRQSRPYRTHSCFVRLRRVETLRWAISPRRGLEICARRAAKMHSLRIARRGNEGRNAFAPKRSRRAALAALACPTLSNLAPSGLADRGFTRTPHRGETNVTPCAQRALGERSAHRTRLKGATARSVRRRAARRSRGGSCAFQARVLFVPQPQAAFRRMGLFLFRISCGFATGTPGGEDVHVFVVGRERFRRQSRPYRTHSCFVRLRRVETLRWAISPRRGLEICARRAAKMRPPEIARRRNEGRNAFAPKTRSRESPLKA